LNCEFCSTNPVRHDVGTPAVLLLAGVIADLEAALDAAQPFLHPIDAAVERIGRRESCELPAHGGKSQLDRCQPLLHLLHVLVQHADIGLDLPQPFENQ
jgi:hypothetical protein